MAKVQSVVKGTLVRMADDSLKPIEEIQVGEEVYSYNFQTKEYTVSPVKKITSEQVESIAIVKLEHGATVECVPTQAFGCKCGAWIPASRMHWRRVLSMGGNPPIVVEVELKGSPSTVYNLLVKDTYTYVITDRNIVISGSIK